jgi:hypothetical protein
VTSKAFKEVKKEVKKKMMEILFLTLLKCLKLSVIHRVGIVRST